MLTCNSVAPYRVELGSNGQPAATWTRGDSCGGPNINAYTSPPLSGSRVPENVRVEVPPKVKYYVTVYGLVPLGADANPSPKGLL
ncbi:MAG: hypothetical protein JWO79_1835 [Actinomycetia bacterium]|nr:hypothetical protein [Actinomycetes bacterium]